MRGVGRGGSGGNTEDVGSSGPLRRLPSRYVCEGARMRRKVVMVMKYRLNSMYVSDQAPRQMHGNKQRKQRRQRA